MARTSFFPRAVEVVLQHEGHTFVDDPKDPGGPSKWGISLRFLRNEGIILDKDQDGDTDAEDIKLITRAEAEYFYKVKFWDRYGYDRIIDPWVAIKVFDLCVNMGAKQAHICLQRAVRATIGETLVQDGIFGPKTEMAVNIAPPFQLLAAYRSEAAGFYRLLVQHKPWLSKYRRGWLNRAYY
jgi:lysozyme family protein